MPDIEYPDLPDTWGVVEWESRRGFTTRAGLVPDTQKTATRVSSHRTVYRLILSRSSPFLLFEKMAISMSLRFLKQNKTYSTEAAAVAAVPNSSEN